MPLNPLFIEWGKNPFYLNCEFRLGLLYLFFFFLPSQPCAQDEHVAVRRSKYELLLGHWWLTFIISLLQEKGKYIAGMEFSLGFCEQARLCSFGSRDNTISMPSWGATIISLLQFWLLLSLVCWPEASGLLLEVLEMLFGWAFLNWTCLGRLQKWSKEEQRRTKQTLVEFSSIVALTGIFNSKQWDVLCSKVGWHKKNDERYMKI